MVWKGGSPRGLLGAWHLSLPMPIPHGGGGPYQGSTAEQDHEDNESLEPVVLDDLEASPAERPPLLPAALGDVHVEAGAALHTSWGGQWGHQVTGLRAASGGTVTVSPPLAQGAPPNTRVHVPHRWLERGGNLGCSSPSPPTGASGPPSAAYSAEGWTCRGKSPAQALQLSAVPTPRHCPEAAVPLHSPGSLGKTLSPGLSPKRQGPSIMRVTVTQQPILSTCLTPGHARAVQGFRTAAPRALPPPSVHTHTRGSAQGLGGPRLWLPSQVQQGRDTSGEEGPTCP